MKNFVFYSCAAVLPLMASGLAQAQKKTRKPSSSGASSGSGASPSSSGTSSPSGLSGSSSSYGTDPLVEEMEMETLGTESTQGDSEYLRGGNWSLDIAAISGGSLWKQGTAGARYFLSPGQALSLGILVGIDKKQEQKSYGVSLSSMTYFGRKGKAQPFIWGQISAGQDKKEGQPAEDEKWKGGVSLGAGVEVFLLKELSVSARTGVSTQLSPSDSLQIVTGTGELGMHFNVGVE